MRILVDGAKVANISTAERPKFIRSEAGHAQPTINAEEGAPETASLTREPQYSRCVELKNTIGLTTLGLMTNQVWYDDPRRLTFLLARYKFVAKMLSGRKNAGEVGCGDAFGTRVVLQEVPDVTVYDFDPVFIEDIRARQDERWRLRAEMHDIVRAPLPRKHEALFSLDVIEHIAGKDEHDYLVNLRDLLVPEGVLIIGTPSIEFAGLRFTAEQGRPHQLQERSAAQSATPELFWRGFLVLDERRSCSYWLCAHGALSVRAVRGAEIPDAVTMPPRLRIGIDFDNTIIAYDHVFCAVAKRCGLLDPEFFGGKQAVRDAIRLSPAGELGWQRLQGQVYGKGLADATVVAGFEDFLRRCGRERCVVLVVSHKTEFGHFDPDRINLRTTALDWMAAKGLFARRARHLACKCLFRKHARRKSRAHRRARPDAFHRRSRGSPDRSWLSAADQAHPACREHTAMPTRPTRVARPGSPSRSWSLAPHDTGLLQATEVARRLVGNTAEVSRLLTGGRNSRIWYVRSGSSAFALKQYPARRDDDLRDRLATETGALRLMEHYQIDTVPRVVAVDSECGFALLSWIDGRDVVDIDEGDIDAAVAFLTAIHRLRATPWAAKQPHASEACLSGTEIVRQINSRLRALDAPE